MDGYKTDKPCDACGALPATIEPRFGYVACEKCSKLAPVEFAKLRDRPWFSLIEDDGSPHRPYDKKVETKGGYGDDRVTVDWFSSSIGDWMCQPGDPTHWRPIEK